jgi:hypothetical protein
MAGIGEDGGKDLHLSLDEPQRALRSQVPLEGSFLR